MPSRSRGDRGSAPAAERGSITAEFAALVPAVLLVLAACLGCVQVVGQQLRLTDAAADAARSLARGDRPDATADRVHRALAAVTQTEREGRFVCVRLTAPAVFVPAAAVGVTVSARSCALDGGL